MLGRTCADLTTAGYVLIRRVTLKAKIPVFSCSQYHLFNTVNCKLLILCTSSIPRRVSNRFSKSTPPLHPSSVYKAQSFTTLVSTPKGWHFVPREVLFHTLEALTCKVPQESESSQSALGQGHSAVCADMRKMPLLWPRSLCLWAPSLDHLPCVSFRVLFLRGQSVSSRESFFRQSSTCSASSQNSTGIWLGQGDYLCLWIYLQLMPRGGTPGGIGLKNSSVNPGDTRDSGWIPGLGRFLGGISKCFYLEISHSSVAAWKIPRADKPGHGAAKSRTWLSTHTRVRRKLRCRNREGRKLILVRLLLYLQSFLSRKKEEEEEKSRKKLIV